MGRVVFVSVITSILVSTATFFALQRLTSADRRGADGVTVPSLVGLRVDQARQVLEAQELLLLVAEQREDPKIAEGRIAHQLPLDGSRVKPGSEVRVSVSTGSNTVQVPVLTGLPLASALQQLEGRGLRGDARARQPSAQVPKESVVASVPAAGAQVTRGSLVALTLSEGAPGLKVPSVIGIAPSRARQLLEQAELKLGRLSYAFDEDQRPGVVLRQEPGAQTLVPPGTAVNLVVNEGE